MSFMFEVGKTYKTQWGDDVTVIGRTDTKGFECLVCSDGKHRYDRSTDSSDAGRVTGTDHDYSYPHNIFRDDKPKLEITRPEKPTCQDCGSDDISFDAACRWDVEKQDYVLTSTMDSGGCNNCGHVFKRVNWREI